MLTTYTSTTATSGNATLVVRPQAVAKKIFLVIGLLLVLDLVSVYLVQVLHTDTSVVRKLVRYFDLNEENTIPAFFSSLLLLLASALLLVIARQAASRKKALLWLLLSAVFLFLALDESIAIHEELTYSVNKMYAPSTDTNGFLRYSWVVPYLLALTVLTAFYAPFLWQLPTFVRALFVASGCIFVTGAVGMESIEGHYDLLYGMHNLYSSLLCALEEVMEMSGVALFIFALLTYIAREQGEIRFSVTSSKERVLDERELQPRL
ncbi:hypothetical protein GCM10022409_42230 [Hymenobacter glaciei]|uniref:Multidrug transporter n=2 Tax=Hymenobacter glaciei TaxID=877209 RepID=A0ABP7URQ8_9BACT